MHSADSCIRLPEIARFDLGVTLLGVVIQKVFVSDRTIIPQPFDFLFSNLGIGGKQDNLMASLGEVAID